MSIYYSVIIPAHNENANLPSLLEEIKDVMASLKKPWEVLVIDDGSTDGTWQTLEQISTTLPELKGLHLQTQSGQSAALHIGFQAARGEAIITLDGDGQNDPHDIPKLLAVFDGIDCVSGQRQRRQDRTSRRWISTMANGTRRWLLGDDIRDTGCSLKVFRASTLQKVKLFKGMHRFLPSLIMQEGGEVKEIPVSHRPRQKGKSNYSICNRGLSTITDLLAVWWMKRRRLQGVVDRQVGSGTRG